MQRKLISFSSRHQDLISARRHLHNMGISLFLRSGGVRLTHKEPVSAQLIVIHQPPHVFCSLFSTASTLTVSKRVAGTCTTAGGGNIFKCSKGQKNKNENSSCSFYYKKREFFSEPQRRYVTVASVRARLGRARRPACQAGGGSISCNRLTLVCHKAGMPVVSHQLTRLL